MKVISKYPFFRITRLSVPIPTPRDEIRYDSGAIDFLDRTWDQFYYIWLGLAADRAIKNSRTIVIKDDVEETANAATKILLADIE